MDNGPDVDEDEWSSSSFCPSDISVAGSDLAKYDDDTRVDGDQSCGVGLALRLVSRGQSATLCGSVGPVVVVEWVVPGGAAASSGKVKAGDVLLAVRETNGLVSRKDPARNRRPLSVSDAVIHLHSVFRIAFSCFPLHLHSVFHIAFFCVTHHKGILLHRSSQYRIILLCKSEVSRHCPNPLPSVMLQQAGAVVRVGSSLETAKAHIRGAPGTAVILTLSRGAPAMPLNPQLMLE
jgi:hypothetical protein